MALGAGAADLLRLVMSREDPLVPTAGAAIGLGVRAAIMSRRVRSAIMLYKSKSARSAGVWNGIRGDLGRVSGRVFFARLARDTHRSGPSPARTMTN